MIGEPELDGEWGPAAGQAGPAQEVVASEPVPARRRARPWWWVAGAVVVTSALWAGGLYAYGHRLAEPEVHYRVVDDLCAPFAAPVLGELMGGLTETAPQAGGRHPALDWAACSRSRDRANASAGSVDVRAMVELHRKTDPSVEFALDTPSSRWFGPDGEGWESVPGLGEQALVTRDQRGDGLRLRVRDGGAVFTVDVMIFRSFGEDGPDPTVTPLPHPDRDVLVAAVVEDMRALMTALRTG
ncbi:hypothetical protein OG444_24675 [Streptomyces sp. NBC_01232]|uniref:hypothetical protein n=1 Tax=unclassified Streptomyces TaxID=2593676 RepID=UPI002E0E03E6|nr:hypothetical protein OG444_24675 [Streptomyces sp. NBC_01232]